MLIVLVILYCIFYCLTTHHNSRKQHRRKPLTTNMEPALVEIAKPAIRFRKKPEWVIREVIRLSALMPGNGCRKIADVFERLHNVKNNMRVSKSTVYNIMIQHKYEIYVLRMQIKQRTPTTPANNAIWSVDLTTITDNKKCQHITFGVIDNGARACLLLKNIADKSSINLLRNLLNIIECYGKPKKIRMDNETVFKSTLFRMGLRIMGIKPQFTEVACPWQNGRIERFFGTLKQNIHKIIITEETLDLRLMEFRYWYNHVRTHNNLKGKTPAEAWSKTPHNHLQKGDYVSLWHGILNGFYLPPD